MRESGVDVIDRLRRILMFGSRDWELEIRRGEGETYASHIHSGGPRPQPAPAYAGNIPYCLAAKRTCCPG
ncbi:hypothetical protein XFF6992_330031 [Xanthomonas citri pv. fuscans]|nr:hypothetical protein XFF6992_330031 [Xanthomonas citri pv. fuscans]